ncbi:META domain-containing protein [Ornithinimicrobium avium]|uniref:META domain-containing protein n=1 Tax=Ornithinimicrobium avium TaxID=2283195 RepID=UPI0013B42647|nr:META domain-containing protein [Ornithinimicrobium avium]
MRTVVGLALAVLALTSCGSVTPEGSGTGLSGRTFLSTAVTRDGAPRELVERSRISLTFADGRLTAQAGCNTMFGDYRVEGEVLVIDALGTTEMGCPDGLAAQDDWLSGLLSSRPRLELHGEQLVLVTTTDTVTLLDRVVADPDRPLVGTVWRVDALTCGEAVSSVPVGAEASLTFGEDGTVQVRGGCNTGSASYTAVDRTVSLGPVAMTRMACEGGRGELEAAVLRVLDAGELQLTITADRLTLTTGRDGLVLRAG